MRRMARRGWLFVAPLIAAMCVCCEDDSAVDPPRFQSEAVEDAWFFLDIFLVFRDRLPANPESYTSPVDLYRAVREPWTVYYTNDQARQLFSLLASTEIGMGVLIDSVARGLLVTQVIDSSPAHRAGVLRGDTVLSVNDSICAGRPVSVVLDWIAGQEGDIRVLRLVRLDTERTVTVTLGPYTAPTVYVDSLDSLTAYIGLTGFYNETVVPGGSAEEFRTALDSTRWASYTVIDLRHNGGGYVNQCLSIAGEFVARGTQVVRATERELTFSVRGGDTTWSGVTIDTVWTTDSAGDEQSRRCYVLVDGYTASASEILVSCLRDWRGSDITIVGERTYGKGRGQYLIGYDWDADEYFLSDGGVARVTFSVIEPVLGEPYDSIGIIPDYQIGAGEDALDAALMLIQGSVTKSLAKAVAARTSSLGRIMGQLRRDDVEPLLIRTRP
jgi:carboxyl-terminal processing protease